MAAPFLPYGRQTIEEDDIAAVCAALADDYLTTGPRVEEFELALAAASGAPHAVACNSGTAALHLAAAAAGLGPGDAAIVPTMTFVATANVVRHVGAEVRFADVDSDTGLMRPEDLDAALARPGPGTPRAVLPVHLGGQAADMAGLSRQARARGLTIVEDACHALGAWYRRDDNSLARIGSGLDSDMAAFSMHPVKLVAMGEGGALTTRDPTFADSAARMRSHGLVRTPHRWVDRGLGVDESGESNPWYYEMPEPGWNFRAPDILCALGISQLAKAQRFLVRRRAIADAYDDRLTALAPLVRPAPRVPWSDHAFHLYVVLIDFAEARIGRAALMQALRERGIGTQVHYIPVHLQPYYRARYGELRLPGAEAWYRRCLSLPIFPAMTDADVDRVVEALSGILLRR